MRVAVQELSSYLEYVANLKYDEAPDYKRCRGLFSQVLTAHGCKETDAVLNFHTPSTSVSTPKVIVHHVVVIAVLTILYYLPITLKNVWHFTQALDLVSSTCTVNLDDLYSFIFVRFDLSVILTIFSYI